MVWPGLVSIMSMNIHDMRHDPKPASHPALCMPGPLVCGGWGPGPLQFCCCATVQDIKLYNLSLHRSNVYCKICFSLEASRSQAPRQLQLGCLLLDLQLLRFSFEGLWGSQRHVQGRVEWFGISHYNHSVTTFVEVYLALRMAKRARVTRE